MINKVIELYKKYKEIINYLIAGVLTTIVSILSYELFKNLFHIHYIISNVMSWVVAVTFAYFINRKYVFERKNENKIAEFISFVKYRILSLVIETACMYLLVDICKFNDDISKIVVQFIVVVLNYIFSKFFTFKKKGDDIDGKQKEKKTI